MASGRRIGAKTQIFQVKIQLRGVRPPVWRRVLVPGELTLAELHEVVQTAISWANKISGWMQKLAEVLKNLSTHLDKLGSAGKAMKTKVDDFFSGLANPPSASLVNPNANKAFDGQKLQQLGEGAQGSGSGFKDAWQGFKSGGGEYKPWAQGDLLKPSVDMGPDGGGNKFGYEVVKETAKLDDGKDELEK